jgi:hypothetical protein
MFSPNTDDHFGRDVASSADENDSDVPRGPSRGVLRRRSSITISMVRTVPTEDADDYSGPILDNFDDSFDAGQKAKSGSNVDEYGLVMHDDIVLEDNSPQVATTPSSASKIFRLKPLSDGTAGTAPASAQRQLAANTALNAMIGKRVPPDSVSSQPSQNFPSISLRLFNSFEDNDASSPICNSQTSGIPASPYQSMSNGPRRSVVVMAPAATGNTNRSASPAPSSSSKLTLSAATFSPGPRNAPTLPVRGMVTTPSREQIRNVGPQTPVGQTLLPAVASTPQTKVENSSMVKGNLKSDSARKPVVAQQSNLVKKRSGSSLYSLSTSDAYLEAHASDSINEIHPEMLKVRSNQTHVYYNSY